MQPTIIVVTGDCELVADILDLVTGRAAALLRGIQGQTETILHQAEAIKTDPPATTQT